MRKDIKFLFLFLSPSSTLNVLSYPLILGIIKTNGLVTLSKNPIKYSELDLDLIVVVILIFIYN